MTNYLKIVHDAKGDRLVMDRTFAKNASIVGSKEYDMLQRARADYPEYKVEQRTIKSNPHKDSYKGLTYDRMREYIYTHEQGKRRADKLAELEEMIFISKCHSRGFRYPTIKSWFLEEYPQIDSYEISKTVTLIQEEKIKEFPQTTENKASGQ